MQIINLERVDLNLIVTIRSTATRANQAERSNQVEVVECSTHSEKHIHSLNKT